MPPSRSFAEGYREGDLRRPAFQLDRPAIRGRTSQQSVRRELDGTDIVSFNLFRVAHQMDIAEAVRNVRRKS